MRCVWLTTLCCPFPHPSTLKPNAYYPSNSETTQLDHLINSDYDFSMKLPRLKATSTWNLKRNWGLHEYNTAWWLMRQLLSQAGCGWLNGYPFMFHPYNNKYTRHCLYIKTVISSVFLKILSRSTITPYDIMKTTVTQQYNNHFKVSQLRTW